MASRTLKPTLAESSEKARALVCAFATVPGSSAVGVRAEQLLLGFSEGVDIDALTLKGTNLTHIQRVGKARMLRVPVPDLVSGEGTAARGPFLERLAAFKRALQRQLDADSYDCVICLDLFSAGAVAPLLVDRHARSRLIVEVGDVPSASYDKRYPVSPNDTETRRAWDLAERAALKSAACVIVPSRHAARLLSERTDPRTLRVVHRFVDTRVFQPPTMELSLDDVKTVAFLGGREGGSRSLAVTATVKALLTRVPDCRILVLGTPSRAERHLVDELQRRGLMERVVPVDVTTAAEMSQALAAAHVVVVPAGAEGDVYGMPHRALEAMACGRPLVVTGTEGSYKDVLTPGVHARVVSPVAADEVAGAVAGLLSDELARGALVRAGLKLAQKHDLGARLAEWGQVLSEAAGVRFEAALPPLEEVTAPAPVSRAIPATPLPQQRVQTQPKAKEKSSSKKSKAAPAPKQALVSAEEKAAVGDKPDMWAGDTLLDPSGLPPQPSEPPPERVKGAMLITQSGSAERTRPHKEKDATTAESSGPARPTPTQRVTTTPPTTPAPATTSGPTGPGGARSLQLAMADNDDDDWSRDTIADASPLADATKAPPTGEKPPATHPPRSLLVEAGVGDMTAEDKPATSSSE